MSELIDLLKKAVKEDVKRVTEDIKSISIKLKNTTLKESMISITDLGVLELREMLGSQFNKELDILLDKADTILEKNTVLNASIASAVSLFDLSTINSALNIINSLEAYFKDIEEAAFENMIFCRLLGVFSDQKLSNYMKILILEADDQDKIIEEIVETKEVYDISNYIYNISRVEKNELDSIIKKCIIEISYIFKELNPLTEDLKGERELFLKSRGNFTESKKIAEKFYVMLENMKESISLSGTLESKINKMFENLIKPISELVDNNFFLISTEHSEDSTLSSIMNLKRSSAVIKLEIENYFYIVSDSMKKVSENKEKILKDGDLIAINNCLNNIKVFINLIQSFEDSKRDNKNMNNSFLISKINDSALMILRKTKIDKILKKILKSVKEISDNSSMISSAIKNKSTLYRSYNLETKISKQAEDISFYLNGLSDFHYSVIKSLKMIETLKNKYEGLSNIYNKLSYSLGISYGNALSSVVNGNISVIVGKSLFDSKFGRVISGGNTANINKKSIDLTKDILKLKEDAIEIKNRYKGYYDFVNETYKSFKENEKILRKSGII